jgi:DNA-binding PadR family transcriptional regulator
VSSTNLTTTSYAILGLLAIQPWSTYELAQQMERSLGRVWPRAQSKLYEEPKKLVAHGLAKASVEQVGQRPRTRYAITPKGRRALATWLREPGAGPVLEFEQLLKSSTPKTAPVPTPWAHWRPPGTGRERAAPRVWTLAAVIWRDAGPSRSAPPNCNSRRAS